MVPESPMRVAFQRGAHVNKDPMPLQVERQKKLKSLLDSLILKSRAVVLQGILAVGIASETALIALVDKVRLPVVTVKWLRRV